MLHPFSFTFGARPSAQALALQEAAKGVAIEDGKVDGAVLLLREALRRSPGSAEKPGSSSDRVLSTPNNSQPWEQLLDVEPGVGYACCCDVSLSAVPMGTQRRFTTVVPRVPLAQAVVDHSRRFRMRWYCQMLVNMPHHKAS